MKLDQFMIDHYKPDDMIEVQCLWLQNEFRIAQKLTNEANTKDLLIARLARKIECLEAKVAFLEIESKYVLDERA